ncbi:hypothetical protein INT45_000907 [Circinella minor]|uniref:Uncharacterized protein n=1 Tax=Circinella minor TaxID=1195481 RepID=A0A8H7VFM7_9FUNG|nr:hypothetical protein INT45_000907 [Circinella minor]
MIKNGYFVLPVNKDNIFENFGTTLKFVNKLDGSLYNVAVSYKDGYLHVLPSETPESSADEDLWWVEQLSSSIDDLRLRLNTERIAINNMAEQYRNTKASMENVIDSIQNSFTDKNELVKTWNLIQVSDDNLNVFGGTVDDLQSPYEDFKNNFLKLSDDIKTRIQGSDD